MKEITYGLYDYFRSSAAYRVRIALNLKGIAAQHHEVHLLNEGGQHRKPDYLKLNPQGLVPALVLPSGDVLTQSLAIIEYLEECHPDPALLPADPVERARVRAAALSIACDIHPLNNLRVLGYIKDRFGQGEDAVTAWYHHWIEIGFAALEAMLDDGAFCFGDAPGLADVCLVPQVFNARRFKVDMDQFPRITAIDARLNEMPAFVDAHPDRHGS